MVRTGLMLGAAIATFAGALPAAAQTPAYPPPPPVAVPAQPLSPEAEIAACLCLHRSIGALGAEMSARRQAYEAAQNRVSGLDAQMARERATMNVDDPDAVARFRALLAERDAAFRRSTGSLASDLAAVVSRYNAAVSQYNERCANRPQDPILLHQVEATLSCPAP